jgi:hypothetical protein
MLETWYTTPELQGLTCERPEGPSVPLWGRICRRPKATVIPNVSPQPESDEGPSDAPVNWYFPSL